MSARFGDLVSRVALLGLALAAVSMLAPQSLAAPVVWSGNGHSYEFVRLPNNQSWDEAKAAAEAMSLDNGDVGYLTTINSADEQDLPTG